MYRINYNRSFYLGLNSSRAFSTSKSASTSASWIRVLLISALIAPNLTSHSAFANDVSQTFTYQGRIYDSTGTTPLSDIVDFLLDIYDPSGTCLLYEEKQLNVDLTSSSGLFAVQVGSVLHDAKRSRLDPGLTLAQVFANTSAQTLSVTANCPSGYTPSAADVRYLRVTLTPHTSQISATLSPDQVIGSQAAAVVAQTLQGLGSNAFIQSASGVTGQGSVSLASLMTLTGGSSTDASSYHNHDSLYVKLGSGGGTSLGGGTVYTTGNFGVGTSTPVADIGLGGTVSRTVQVERNTLAGTAGNNLVLSAGGATSGGTNQSGGTLVLSSGVSTGSGGSAIQFKTASGGTPGTSDQAVTSKMILTSGGLLGLGTLVPSAQLEIDTATTSTKGQVIRGLASQTGNLLELQNSGGTALSYFDASGNLMLPGAPTLANQAATMSYVTGLISGLGTSVSSFNTRTGAVTLSSSDVSTALAYTPVNKSGDTLTGPLILAADPSTNLGAATKQYVTTSVASRILAAGDTMSGLLRLSSSGTSLTAAGFVGIGTTTPGSLLNIVSSITASTVNEASTNTFSITSGFNQQSLYMGFDSTNYVGVIEASESGAYDNISLQPRGGSVGIGVITPGSTLQIAGAFSQTNYDTGTPTTGNTMTASANSPGFLITPAGTLASLIFLLPSSPADGQQFWVATSKTITSATWKDSGGTTSNVVGGPASLTTSGARFVYSSGTSKWYSI